MDLVPLISTFLIIAVAELGDKTQLATMTLSSRCGAMSVFVGAVLGISLVNSVSIIAGTALGELIPMQLISLAGAAIFIGYGIITLLSKDDGPVKLRGGKSAIATSFLMISMMELGDKTQFSVIALAAKYVAPLQVFVGAFLAYLLLMAIVVVVGNRLLKFVKPKYLRIFTGTLFIVFGAAFFLSAFYTLG